MGKIKFPTFKGFVIAEPVIIIVATAAMIALPIVSAHWSQGRMTGCSSNQKQIALAVLMYVQENNEIFPGAENTWESIDVSGKILECPAKRRREGTYYAYNANLSNLSLSDLYKINHEPAYIALTADSDREDSKMTSGDDIAFRHEGREKNYAMISFVDGHVIATKDLHDISFK